MKNSILIAIISLSILSSCKYEDGPKFSFRTKKSRIVNVWYIDKVYENGEDKTESYKSVFVNYRLEIKNDDNYKLSYRFNSIITYIEDGTWKFSGDKKNLILMPSNTTQENSNAILRLKNHEFWVKFTTNNTTLELHLSD